uniref:Superoxide dismutase [Cu-Zn] n=1 Tax=Reticulitermes speratus TaxID=60591 RepID=A0A3G9D4G4_9NEOP
MKETRVLMIFLLVAVTAAQYPVRDYVQQPGDPEHHVSCPKSAVCNLIPSKDSTVSGQVQLYQASQAEPVEIIVSVQGLKPPGLHGFHLHRDGNTDDDCKAAGPHFNPFNHTHGGPEDEFRHAGDFGNILADEYGNASYRIKGTQISLCPGSVGYSVGRAFVVHEGIDDLGKGGNEESLRTGNAGGRLACCVVEAVNY